MKSKFLKSLMCVAVGILVFSACGIKKIKAEKRQKQYFEYFDTFSTFEAYTESQEEFNEFADIVEEELKKYHSYFDIYNNYDGLNNVKTINDNAGIGPVETEEEIVYLIAQAKEYYNQTGGKFNIAMGAVLKLWHNERTAAEENPDNARLPETEALKAAAEHISIENIEVDTQKNSVYIKDSEESLDLGGLAKGYAAEKITQRLKEEGCTSAILNLGGNVCTIGKPVDKDKWKIGVESSDESNEIVIADVVYADDIDIVSSGDYQRYYTVDGKNYHHIIDSGTLMPADRYKGVTVICKNSMEADMLSTSAFLLPVEEGKRLMEKYNAEAVWFYADGKTDMTDGYESYRQG